MAENGDRLNRMDRQIEHLLQSAVLHDGQIRELTENQRQLTAAIANLAALQSQFVDEVRADVRKTEERFRETDERMRHTDERLDALISTVDSLIRRQPPA